MKLRDSTLNLAAKGQVLKVLRKAWYCDCGCGGVYEGGAQIGGGKTEQEAWENALTHHRLRKRDK
jgi:hypothetical protein